MNIPIDVLWSGSARETVVLVLGGGLAESPVGCAIADVTVLRPGVDLGDVVGGGPLQRAQLEVDGDAAPAPVAVVRRSGRSRPAWAPSRVEEETGAADHLTVVQRQEHRVTPPGHAHRSGVTSRGTSDGEAGQGLAPEAVVRPPPTARGARA